MRALVLFKVGKFREKKIQSRTWLHIVDITRWMCANAERLELNLLRLQCNMHEVMSPCI